MIWFMVFVSVLGIIAESDNNPDEWGHGQVIVNEELPIRVNVCSLNVLLVASHVLGLDISAEQVSAAVPIDKEGNTSMLQLKRAAETLGIDVVALKEADVPDVLLALRRGQLVILYVVVQSATGRTKGHYVIAVRETENKNIVVVDFPNKLEIGSDRLRDVLDRSGGYVLLLSVGGEATVPSRGVCWFQTVGWGLLGLVAAGVVCQAIAFAVKLKSKRS